MAKPITDDPLEAVDVEGLKRPERLVELFNALQGASAASLNGTRSTGITLGNVRHVLLEDKELVVPSDWHTLSLAGGWADFGGGHGTPAVRKSLDGRVEVREVLERAAGAPAAGSLIAALPEWAWPQALVRRAAEATGNALGGYQVTSAGQLQFLFGNPTTYFALNGGSWQAADPTLPEWTLPLRVKLEERVTLRRVFVEARRADSGESGLQPVAEVLGARVEPAQSVGEKPTLVVPRICGLREGARYRLTLLLLVE